MVSIWKKYPGLLALLFYSSPGNYNWLLLDSGYGARRGFGLTPVPLTAKEKVGEGDLEEKGRRAGFGLLPISLEAGGTAYYGLQVCCFQMPAFEEGSLASPLSRRDAGTPEHSLALL